MMVPKKILDRERIRQTHNGFGFIPHQFLRDGFLSALEKGEAFLYLFYILAADRYGISFYSDRRICELLSFSPRELRQIRDHLIHKDLICCETPVCQVLELPTRPVLLANGKNDVCSFADLKHRLER
jgi:hypothetical protein